MTKRELVYRTISHSNPGKIPQAIDLTSMGFDAYGNALLYDYQNEQVADDLKVGILSKAQAVALSIGNHILHITPPWWKWHDPEGIFRTGEEPPDRLPDTQGCGDYQEFFDKLALIREHYDVYILAVVWGSYWEKAKQLRGMENFLSDLINNREWSQALLDMIIRKNTVMLENILTAPELDGVLLGSDWGTQIDLMISPECFRTMFKPGEKDVFQLIKKYQKHVFVHSCGKINRIMGDLVEMGVDCLNPVQPECMDLTSLKNDYGDHITWYGGISTQKVLPFGTPDEVKKETGRIIELMYKNGGYITSPSQQIQTDVPYENLIALIEKAGQYWR